jgi:hypothetical protein
MFECHHRVMPGDSKMIRIPNGYPTGTTRTCFVNGNGHSPGANHEPQSLVAVNHTRTWRFVNKPNGRLAVDSPGFPEPDIATQACQPMRINTTQVGMQEHISGQLGVAVGASHVQKYLYGELPQLGVGADYHAAKIVICSPHGPARRLQINWRNGMESWPSRHP